MTTLQERLEKLTPDQRKLFEKRLAADKKKAESKKIVLALQDGNSSGCLPIFCLHPPLGAIGYLINVVRHFPADQPVFGVQSPAFSNIRDPFDTMEEMASYYIQAIKSVHPQGPYLLLGHSSGAYIAYEMALQLQKAEEKVPLLVIIDQAAPLPRKTEGPSIMDMFKSDDLYDNAEIQFFTAWAVAVVHNKNLPFTLEELQPLSNENRYVVIADFLKSAGFIPNSAGSDFVKTILKMYICHSRADETYKEKFTQQGPGKPYSGKLLLFRCTEETAYEGTDIIESVDTSPYSHWDQFCSSEIDVVGIPNSNHITMVIEPCARDLANRLQPYLQEIARLYNQPTLR